MNTVVPGGDEPDSGPEESPAEATVLRMLLGAQLRRLREAVGIPAEKAGYEIRASRSKISRMETGRVGLKVRDVEDLLTLYGVLDEQQRAKIITLARRSREPEWWAKYNDILPDWFETYLGLESAAASIRSFEMQFVPGLFQTEDYARTIIRADHPEEDDTEITRRVELRMARQAILKRPVNPPALEVALRESVLRCPVGGTEIMAAQLDRLAGAAGLPNVSMRVVPFSAGFHLGMLTGGFTLLRFPLNGSGTETEPDTVYSDSFTGAIYLDKPGELARYSRAFAEIWETSLDEDSSRAFIGRAAEALRDG